MLAITGTHVERKTGFELEYIVHVIPASDGGCDWIGRVQLPGMFLEEWLSGSLPANGRYRPQAIDLFAAVGAEIDRMKLDWLDVWVPQTA